MCTDLILPFDKDNPGNIISGRTMDFSDSPTLHYDTYLIKVPKGYTFTATAPKGATGHVWTNRYGFVGVSMIPRTPGKKASLDASDPNKIYYSDGMNSEGLSAAMLWLSYTEYEKPIQGDDAKCIDVERLISFLLGTCATVEDVVSSLKDVVVWLPELWEIYMPYHISVHDRNGKSLVVDFKNGKEVIYNNDAIGVLTNGPGYAWHAVNLNYLYNSMTSADNDQNRYIRFEEKNGQLVPTVGTGYQYEVLGAGMLGLPGDSSSPSRFIRASRLKQCLPKDYDTRDGVQYALQILGRIAVTRGEVLTCFKSDGTKEDPMDTLDMTLWMLVRDHTERAIYYATALNHNLQAVKLDDLDLSKGKVTTMSIQTGAWYTDTTSQLKA